MPLFAADPAAPDLGNVTGPVGAVLGGVMLLLYVYDRLAAVRSSARKAAAEADTAETDAEEKMSRSLHRELRRRDVRIATLEKRHDEHRERADRLADQNVECEQRAERQEEQIVRQQDEIDSLKGQNADQQRQLDAISGTLRVNGLVGGSGAHRPLDPPATS